MVDGYSITLLYEVADVQVTVIVGQESADKVKRQRVRVVIDVRTANPQSVR